LTVTVSDGENTSKEETIQVSVDKDTFVGSISYSSLKLYPNPAKEYFTIEGLDNSIVDVNIYDIAGNKVATYNNVSTERRYNIDFNSGVYLVIINNNNKSITRKLVIK
ncbi:MAG: T9SS type A sorting domain-containing protein, partial [Hyphomicrobiales bacterium]